MALRRRKGARSDHGDADRHDSRARLAGGVGGGETQVVHAPMRRAVAFAPQRHDGSPRAKRIWAGIARAQPFQRFVLSHAGYRRGHFIAVRIEDSGDEDAHELVIRRP